jgi:hypothetical protein
MNEINEVQIFLTTPEALMFRSFQKFHETFALLCEKGVFDTKNGSCELHFDPDGNISSIVKREMIYKHNKLFTK